MATTITPPAAYSSIKSPCLFEVKRSADTIAEISINGYQKHQAGTHFFVNVSPYYAGDFAPHPLATATEGFTFYDGVQVGRVTAARLTVDSVVSSSVNLLCADRRPMANRFMSDLKGRIIAAGQIDEVAVYATVAARLVWYGQVANLSPGLTVAAFRVPAQPAGKFAVYLHDTSGNVLDTLTYLVTENTEQRLAWVNSYGAIDYWNFPFVNKSATKVTMTKIYAAGGYMPTSKQAEDTVTLTTYPLPEKQIAALCQILSADAVWVLKGGVYHPIDIVSDSVEFYNGGKVSTLQIQYRSKQRRL